MKTTIFFFTAIKTYKYICIIRMLLLPVVAVSLFPTVETPSKQGYNPHNFSLQTSLKEHIFLTQSMEMGSKKNRKTIILKPTSHI
jgi:hypothetical protein